MWIGKFVGGEGGDVIREEREECGALYLHVITYNLGTQNRLKKNQQINY